MPTSFSKPLITAPLSLVQTEAHQPACGYTMLRVYFHPQGASPVPAPSPGFCHSLCPQQPQCLVTSPIPTTRDLKGCLVKWTKLTLAAPSTWVPLANHTLAYLQGLFA